MKKNKSILLVTAVIILVIAFFCINFNEVEVKVNTQKSDTLNSASIDVSSNEKANYANVKRVSVHANYITFDNIDELSKVADLIVIANATQLFQDRKHMATYFDDGNVQDFYTLTNISIEKIIKGENEVQGNQLTIIEPVSYFESEKQNTIVSREGYLELARGG